MSETIQALERINDSDFEILVANYLRMRKPELQELIRTGVNKKGRSIGCPVDSIKFSPGSPPTIFKVECTITELKNLNEKWLNETVIKGRKLGDLPKAIKEFEIWKKEHPEAKSKIFLACNSFIGKELELYHKVMKYGSDKGVEVEIIEGSILIDFLDLNADGQYIRDTLLDITPGRLSKDLLLEFANHSLVQHYQTVAFARVGHHVLEQNGVSTTDKKLIKRDVFDDILSIFEIPELSGNLVTQVESTTGKLPMIILRGVSGFGKSTLLHQLGQVLNTSEKAIALWLPAEELITNSSLEAVLLKLLQKQYPSLNDRAGGEALTLTASFPGGLILLVDDLNRLAPGNQQKAFNTLISWSHQVAKSVDIFSGMGRHKSNLGIVRFVVPVWPTLEAFQTILAFEEKQKISSPKYKENTIKWHLVDVAAYSSREKKELVAMYSANSEESGTANPYHVASSYEAKISQIIEILNGDPFLCGIEPEIIRSYAFADQNQRITRGEIIKKMFETLIQDTARETATQINEEGKVGRATPQEIIRAIEDLLELVVQSDTPEPRWQQIRNFVGNREADLLHVLASTNRLGWVSNDNPLDTQECWRWKHTRLRDALLGRWLAQRLTLQPFFTDASANHDVLTKVLDKDFFSLELISDNVKSWLGNPGLIQAWALSLIFMPDSESQFQTLELFGLGAPLVLAEILRLNLVPTEEKLRKKIATGLKQTLEKYPDNSPFYIPNLKHLIFDRLEYTLEPMVLELTESSFHDFPVRTARIINGDIQTAVSWLSENADDFVPHFTRSFFDQPLEALAVYYQNEPDEFANRLRQIVEREPTNTEILRAALVIAGYTNWSELAWPLWDIWNSLKKKNKNEALLELVWMLSRCGDKSIQSRLSQAIDLALSTISDKPREKNDTRSDLTEKFLEPFGWAVRGRSITPIATQTWVDAAQRHLKLVDKLSLYIFRYLDHTLAIATFLRESIKYLGFFGSPIDPFASNRGFEDKIVISPATREGLWNTLIINEQEPPTIRQRALKMWSWDSSSKDLELLRQVGPASAIFEEVLKLRLKQRDNTAREALLERISSSPEVWCVYTSHLYNEPGVAQALFDNFEEAMKGQPSPSAAFIVQYIPPQGVEELIKKHRDLFLKNKRTWTPLWKSEVPAALILLREAIEKSSKSGEDDKHSLKYIFSGISSGSFPYPITQNMLDGILPVVDKLPLESLAKLAELATRSGFIRWVQQNLPQVLASTDRAINHWIREEELIAQLDRAVQSIPEGAEATFDNLIGLDFERDYSYRFQFIDVSKVVKKWVGLPPEPNHLIIAAMLIAGTGFSPGLDWWLSLEPEGELGQYVVVDKIINKEGSSHNTEAETSSTQTLHEMWSAIFSILQIKYWQG
jgi:energy-coupling factor transporter ATP-binding protein EcfA2